MRTIHRSPFRDAQGKIARGGAQQALGPKWKHVVESEDRAAREIGAVLDDRFVMIRNTQLPEVGVVDMILVGPTGISTLALHHAAGMYKAESELWLRYDTQRMQFVREPRNPIQQARQAAAQLRDYLRARDLPVPWVNAALVVTNPETRVTLEGPAVTVYGANEIGSFASVDILGQEIVMDDEDVDTVVDVILERGGGGSAQPSAARDVPGRRGEFIGMTRPQLALLAVLALLNLCVLGGFLLLVVRDTLGA